MKFSRNTGWLACAVLCMNAVWMAGCSDSSSETAAEEDDTRLSIQGFLANPTEPLPIFGEAENDAIRAALNKASFSFVEYMWVDPSETVTTGAHNVVTVTWPMLGTFPLTLLPAQGATAAELEAYVADFGEPESLLGFTHLLQQTHDEADAVMQHHVWWQEGSRFEPDFLEAFNAITTPEHHTVDYRLPSVENDVQSLLGEYYGNPFYSILQNLPDTRLISLQNMQQTADFSDSGYTVEPFAGALQTGYFGVTLDVPMLRIHGAVDRFENDVLVARRISLDSAGINLIAIHPKPGQFQSVQDNVESAFAAMNTGWVGGQGAMILPVMSQETERSGLGLASWRGAAAYSLAEADLRGMDHVGGLYLQSDSYLSRFSMSQAGLALSAVNAHAVSFSEENQTYHPGAGSWSFGSVVIVNGTPLTSFTCEEDVVPDMAESIFIVEDQGSGLIQAVVSFVWVEDESLETCYSDDLGVVDPIWQLTPAE